MTNFDAARSEHQRVFAEWLALVTNTRPVLSRGEMYWFCGHRDRRYIAGVWVECGCYHRVADVWALVWEMARNSVGQDAEMQRLREQARDAEHRAELAELLLAEHRSLAREKIGKA